MLHHIHSHSNFHETILMCAQIRRAERLLHSMRWLQHVRPSCVSASAPRLLRQPTSFWPSPLARCGVILRFQTCFVYKFKTILLLDSTKKIGKPVIECVSSCFISKFCCCVLLTHRPRCELSCTDKLC